MVQGVVNARIEATIILEISGDAGRSQEVEAVVDTGFSEFLILGSDLASELQLESAGVDYLTLADGSLESFEVFNVSVMWDGLTREIEAHAAQSSALVGMGLLHGHRLVVDVVEGGRVAIEAHG